MEYLLAVVIVIGVFLIARELVCWYWKINAAMVHLKSIDENLAKLASSTRTPVSSQNYEKPQETVNPGN